jgi:hypothetical protein
MGLLGNSQEPEMNSCYPCRHPLVISIASASPAIGLPSKQPERCPGGDIRITSREATIHATYVSFSKRATFPSLVITCRVVSCSVVDEREMETDVVNAGRKHANALITT